MLVAKRDDIPAILLLLQDNTYTKLLCCIALIFQWMEYTGVSNILGAAGLAEQEIIHDYTICTM